MHAALKKMNFRQLLGWLLLFLSCVAWLLVPAVPFLPLDLAAKGGLTIGLIALAEITGWGCLPLLGPEITAVIRIKWRQVKAWIKQHIARSESND